MLKFKVINNNKDLFIIGLYNSIIREYRYGIIYIKGKVNLKKKLIFF